LLPGKEVPKLHLSSQKPGTRTSHADYIEQNDFDELQDWMEKIRSGEEYDLMIEAKLKKKLFRHCIIEPFITDNLLYR
jgi:UV DNA damage repair endonuclease